MSAKFYPKKSHFESKSQVAPNSLIFNHELTEPAKIFLLSLNAIYTCTQNWIPIQSDLEKRLGWGRDKMQNAIKSAVSAGYLKVYQQRNNTGQFTANEFEFDLDGGYLKDNDFLEEKPSHTQYEPMGGFQVTDVSVSEKPTLPCSNELTMSKETTTCLAVAVFFDCLIEIPIDEYEKVWISKNYDEETVRHAVAYATNPNTKIKTSLVQVIKWACVKKPKISTTKQEDEEQNKALAFAVGKDAVIPEGCNFEVLNKCIEITFGGNVVPFVLEYSQSSFKEKFKEALKKYRILPK